MARMNRASASRSGGLGEGWLGLLLLVLVGNMALIASAKLQVPFYPVPMTLQTMVVLLLALTLDTRVAFGTVLLYLAEGAVGLPVFAGTPEKGIGLAYMVGPTGGYLVGFAVAAWLVGRVVEWRQDAQAMAFAALGGMAAIYVCGWLWLATLIGAEPAFVHGILPFIWGDLLKTVLAVAAGLGAHALLPLRNTR
jgi:biotin transport system substrate-specific component